MISSFNREVMCPNLPRETIYRRILHHMLPLGLYPIQLNEQLSTLTVHRRRERREDETARKRTGHPLAYMYAVAQKMKPLALHSHSCISAA